MTHSQSSSVAWMDTKHINTKDAQISANSLCISQKDKAVKAQADYNAHSALQSETTNNRPLNSGAYATDKSES